LKGSVLIIIIYIMAAMSFLLITSFSIMESHFYITRNEELHNEAYYLAEAGINYALNELQQIVFDAHQDCLEEFDWDPYRQPDSSMQESAREYVAARLGSYINSRLISLGYLTRFPGPDIALDRPDAKIEIKIKFTDISKNPSRLLISSRCEIGNIRRRIDSEVLINKISGVYNSILFDYALLTGSKIIVSSKGSLKVYGSVFSEGGLQVDDGSSITVEGQAVTKKRILIADNSKALFKDNIICRELSAKGQPSSFAECNGDLYAYEGVSALNSGNIVRVNGKLYICPEMSGLSAGVSASKGASIILGDEVFINGTISYNASMEYLFGISDIPVEGEMFKSCESIGGGNRTFYFPDYSPESARLFFMSDFDELNINQKADLVYEYIHNPPDQEYLSEQYYRHISEIDKDSISFGYDGPFRGYATGLVFAGNQVIKPVSLPYSEEFFNRVLNSMKITSDWEIETQMNIAAHTDNSNIAVESSSFTVIDPSIPIVYIVPEEKDIYLPSGDYEGILITNGSVYVKSGDQVVFKGIIIAGEDLVINGDLTVHKDVEMLLGLMGEQGTGLRRLFRIDTEKQLFEVKSCKEVLYNQQW